jgi:hypothetical protein
MWELILLPASVCRWWSTLFLIHVGKSFHETIPFLGDFLQYIRYIPHDHLIHQGIELQQSPRTFEVGWIRWSAVWEKIWRSQINSRCNLANDLGGESQINFQNSPHIPSFKTCSAKIPQIQSLNRWTFHKSEMFWWIRVIGSGHL